LHEDQQANVRALAGVIRLARGLRKCNIERTSGFASRKPPPPCCCTPWAGRFCGERRALGFAKHLLDTYLGKPLIVKPASPPQILALPSPSENQLPFAAASD